MSCIMMLGKLIFLLAFTVTAILSDQRCCEEIGCHTNDHPFKHLPLPQCLDEIKPTFTLYTLAHPDEGVQITRAKPFFFNPNHKTIVYFHGYRSNGLSPTSLGIKNGFLKRGEFNVILACWKSGADSYYYPTAASNTRSVAMAAANMLEDLVMNGGLNLKDVYCVGHSLGAHTCGHLGKLLKIGRITGLDPAGPLFEGYSPDSHLSRDDANFVDVIHTMGTGGLVLDFGTLKPMGHLDFYPNGGTVQPGCINYANLEEEDLPESYGDFGCSHARASKLFIESLTTTCEFRATKVCSDQKNIPKSCKEQLIHPLMGVEADTYDFLRGLYYLDTNKNAPFCKGYN